MHVCVSVNGGVEIMVCVCQPMLCGDCDVCVSMNAGEEGVCVSANADVEIAVCVSEC